MNVIFNSLDLSKFRFKSRYSFQVFQVSLFLLMIVGLNQKQAHADQIYYVHSDHLSAPSVVTDQNKQVVWRGDRKPFGETTASISTVNMPIRFPGQYEDSETGLHYNLMRDYHPGLGRYLQSDPIGLAGGMSTFGYAGQNPIMAYDPSGEFFFFFAPVLGISAGTAFTFDVALALSVLASANNANIVLSHWDGDYPWDNDGDYEVLDPYGGYNQGDEDDALDLGENLTGAESCALLSEAITALKNRIRGREQNCEDNDGGDPGHWQRINKLKDALSNLEAAMASCN